MDLNRVSIVGTLGRDPETRTMQSGETVCNLSIATSEKWKDKATGEQKEKTEWHRVVLFGQRADVAAKYLSKGSRVFIEGKLQTRKWTDQSGQEKYSTEIMVQGFDGNLILMGEAKGRDPAKKDELDSEVPF